VRSSDAPVVSTDPSEKEIRSEVTRRIKALGRQGKVKDAIKELATMARMGVEPDTLSATALIDACVRSNKMEMAESVFEEMFGELLVPDEVAFMVLVRGYGDQYPPQWTQIASTLSVMEHSYGIGPTILTFNTLLEVCSKTNDEERGMEIIDRMDDQGVVPNDGSFEAVKNRKSLRGRLKKLV
jgi:pentatricopeptide repeat protein